MQHQKLKTDNEYRIALDFVAYYNQRLLGEAMRVAMLLKDPSVEDIYKYHQKHISTFSKDLTEQQQYLAWFLEFSNNFLEFSERGDLLKRSSLVRGIKDNILHFQRERIKKDIIENGPNLIASIYAKCSDEDVALNAITTIFLLKEWIRFIEDNIEHFNVLYQYQAFLEPPSKNFNDALKIKVPYDIKDLPQIIKEKIATIENKPNDYKVDLESFMAEINESNSKEKSAHISRRKTLNGIKPSLSDDIEAKLKDHKRDLYPYIQQQVKVAKLTLDFENAKTAFAAAENAKVAAQNELDQLSASHKSSTFFTRNKFAVRLGVVGAVIGGILVGIALVAAPFTVGLSVLAAIGIGVGAFSLAGVGGLFGGKALDNRAYVKAKQNLLRSNENLEKAKTTLSNAISKLNEMKKSNALQTEKLTDTQPAQNTEQKDWHKPSNNGHIGDSPHTQFAHVESKSKSESVKLNEKKEGEGEGDSPIPSKK